MKRRKHGWGEVGEGRGALPQQIGFACAVFHFSA